MKQPRTRAVTPNGLAGRIASVRRGLGLSQGAFADRLGVCRNTVGLYERGRTPQTAILDRIARTGGVTAEWLLHGTTPERVASTRQGSAWQGAVDILRQ